PGWKQPWGNGPTWHSKDGAYYYGIFWSGMPDLNFRNPAVRAEIHRLAAVWTASASTPRATSWRTDRERGRTTPPRPTPGGKSSGSACAPSGRTPCWW